MWRSLCSARAILIRAGHRQSAVQVEDVHIQQGVHDLSRRQGGADEDNPVQCCAVPAPGPRGAMQTRSLTPTGSTLTLNSQDANPEAKNH